MNNRNKRPTTTTASKTKAATLSTTSPATGSTKPLTNVPLSQRQHVSASRAATVEKPTAKATKPSIATVATAALAAAADSGNATSVGALIAQQRKKALMLKSVSLFLAGSRRFSTTTTTQTKTQRSRRKMDDTSASSCKLTPRQLETLRKRTHFNQHELESLAVIFRKLVVNSNATSRALAANSINAVIPKTHAPVDGIDADCFCELLHSTFDIIVEEFLMERLFIAWQRDHDRQPLRLEPFLFGLSVFLRGTLPERIGFCFRVYDLNGDGWITRDEMFRLLRNCLIHPPQEEDPDEAVREWLDIIVRKMDGDQDGKISFEDYSTAVRADPLLLEAFGQCLPTRFTVISFTSTLG